MAKASAVISVALAGAMMLPVVSAAQAGPKRGDYIEHNTYVQNHYYKKNKRQARKHRRSGINGGQAAAIGVMGLATGLIIGNAVRPQPQYIAPPAPAYRPPVPAYRPPVVVHQPHLSIVLRLQLRLRGHRHGTHTAPANTEALIQALAPIAPTLAKTVFASDPLTPDVAHQKETMPSFFLVGLLLQNSFKNRRVYGVVLQ